MKKPAFLALALWLTITGVSAQTNLMSGIGVSLRLDGPNVVISSKLADSPAAANAGIRPGDRIIAVAQGTNAAVPVNGKLVEAVGMIRGTKGTTVRLTLFSEGEDVSQAREVSIVRGEIKSLSQWGDGLLLTNGTKAPDIEMTLLADGKPEHLSDYAGKVVVLKFWATWCGPCQPSMAALQDEAAKHPGWKGKVMLIAGSVDEGEAKVIAHLEAKGWNQTHNVWLQSGAARAFHINGIPTTYVIDRQGKVAAANPKDLAETINRQLQ